MSKGTCERCGSPVREGARYCYWCGVRHRWARLNPALDRVAPGSRTAAVWAGVLSALAIGLIGVVVLAFRNGGDDNPSATATAIAAQPATADGLRRATIDFHAALLEAEQGRNVEQVYGNLTRDCRARWSVDDFRLRLDSGRDELQRVYGVQPSDITVTGAEVRDVTDRSGESYALVNSAQFPEAAQRINADAPYIRASYEDGNWRFQLC